MGSTKRDRYDQEQNQAPGNKGNDSPLNTFLNKGAGVVSLSVAHKSGASQHKEDGDSPVEDSLYRHSEQPVLTRLPCMHHLIAVKSDNRDTGGNV